MKKIYFISIILYQSIMFSQEMNLPNLTPPSPEAFAISKYGDIQLNENSGFVTQNIPLYEYQAGQLKLPISASYQGAGVKVDDVSTWIGINWTLNAGGVITRIVKDIPDENAVHRVLMSDTELQDYYMNTYDGTTKGAEMKVLATNEQYDTEVDIFQFNFGSHSGSFFLDENKVPRILNNKSQLKIEIDSNFYNNHQIKITTPEGVIYNFGGADAIEQTVRRYVVNGSVTPNDTNDGVTAFYLTTMTHPLYGVINFEYHQNLGTKIIITQKIEKVAKGYEQNPQNIGCNFSSPGEGLTTVSTRIIEPKFLSKIYSNESDYEIIFNSDAIDSQNHLRILRKILIRKKTNQLLIKSIDFTYSGVIAKRFFLSKISFDNDLITQSGHNPSNNVYRFQYNDYASLPDRFSYSQDYAGYFNGINNTTLIPNNVILNPYNNPNNYADRTPNFAYASKGVLTHVYYPTKGYTHFEYEGTKAKKRRTKLLNLWAYRNCSNCNYYSPNNLTDGIPQINLDGSIYGIQNVYENQTAKITVVLQATDSNTSIIPQQEKAILKITDSSIQNAIPTVHNISLSSPTADGYQGVMTVSKTFKFEHSLTVGHSYRIEIIMYVDPNRPIETQTPMEANVVIEFSDGFDIVDDLGVRLKRVTNYSKDNKPESIKRLYYKSTLNQIHNDDNALPYLEDILPPVKTETWFTNQACGGQEYTALIEAIGYGVYVLSDRFDLGNNLGVGRHEIVSVSYGGDNYEQGGVEKVFRKNDAYGVSKIPVKTLPGVGYTSSGIHYDLDNFNSFAVNNPLDGELVTETFFENKNSILKKQKQINYEFTINRIKKINNFISRKKFNTYFINPPCTYDNIISTHELGVYLTESIRNELFKKIETQYIDPVPLGVTDESNYKKIVTETNYEYYADLIGLPSQIKTIKSNTLESKIKNYYPITSSINNLTNISSVAPYVSLRDKHMLSEPIQIDTYQDDELLSRKRTLYKAWPNHGGSILPEKIQFAKGNNDLEERIIFHDYSLWNPSIVSYKNGPMTKYMYNIQNQVLAKIENYQQGASMVELTENNIENYSPCNNNNNEINVTTLYYYDADTHLLKQIKNPNCNNTYYEYDELYRLKRIKDNENNVIKEFDYNYRSN